MLTIPGLVAVACGMWYEAVVMPVLAGEDPRLLAWTAPLHSSAPFLITGFLSVLWLLGLLLIAIATWRARVLPRGAALTFGLGAIGFAAFASVFVPVLGLLAILVFAAGRAWLGTALLSMPPAPASAVGFPEPVHEGETSTPSGT